MCDPRRVLPTIVQAAAAAVVVARLARGRRRRPPLAARRTGRRVSVVIPARDEERRLAACLAGLADDPDVLEVLVVDDRSRDRTADVARAHGARVVPGAELPPGWVGKPWALQQGLEAAAGDVVVSLDADTRPRPGLAGALAGALGDGGLRHGERALRLPYGRRAAAAPVDARLARLSLRAGRRRTRPAAASWPTGR